MESSVKSISKPVIDRLPVNQLDEFACRQLDRVSPFLSSSLLRIFGLATPAASPAIHLHSGCRPTAPFRTLLALFWENSR